MKEEWHPHPGPQTDVLTRNEFEILFGGSRGGGKTDAGIVWLTDCVYHPRYRALVIRRNSDDLNDWIDRARRMFIGLGAEVTSKPAIIKFPSGAVIRTGHLKDDNAYTKYQGHEYQRMLIEELTQIPSEKRYMELLASCRSTIPELRPQIFLTTNPGGVGHGWVKNRFINLSPANVPYYDEDTRRKRIFVPASVDDNPTLIKNDPNYVHFLDGLKKTDEQLWKAWRMGSWDVFVGQVFSEFISDHHVVDKFEYELKDCIKFITYDWGYNNPGCALWLAITPENKYGVRRIYCYRELYQNGKSPEEWANEIAVFTDIEDTKFIVLPHDCFSRPQGGKMIAHYFRERLKGVFIMRGDTLSKGAKKSRVAFTHQYLSDSADGKPYLQLHQKCSNTIRTIPELIYDDVDPETVDKSGEDHPWDALSMGLMTAANKYNLKSGAVKNRLQKSHTVPTFRQDGKGNIQSPDFWARFKDDVEKSKNKNYEFR